MVREVILRAAITAIFRDFASLDQPLAPSAPHRTMSKDDMHRYILLCGHGGADEASADDPRIDLMFRKFVPPHDVDGQQWTQFDQLTCEGFCEFYRQACFDRIENVESDLRVHGRTLAEPQAEVQAPVAEGGDVTQVAYLSLADDRPPPVA